MGTPGLTRARRLCLLTSDCSLEEVGAAWESEMQFLKPLRCFGESWNNSATERGDRTLDLDPGQEGLECLPPSRARMERVCLPQGCTQKECVGATGPSDNLGQTVQRLQSALCDF